MAEQIKIAELSINNKALVASMQETKAAILQVTEENKKLKKSGDETSQTFIKNEAQLKTLKGEYNAQTKVLQATTGATSKLNAELNKEIKSIDSAAKNNKELKAIRNQLNATTEEGAKQIADINKKLDQNTDFIKDNTSALEKQKQNIGNYQSAISKARILTVAFGAALKAAGIGLIVAAVVKLTAAFGRNQKVMDFVNVAGAAFARVMNDIVNFLVAGIEPAIKFMKAIFSDPVESIKTLGRLIKNNLIERFESMLEVIGFLGSAAKKFFSGDFAGALSDAKLAGGEFVDVLTGVDDSLKKAGDTFNKVKEAVSGYATEVLATAAAQVELAKSSDVAIAKNKIILEQGDRTAEQLRQIRDDSTKTFDERISANAKLGEVLNTQEKLMIKNANLVVANAAAQHTLNNNTESYVALLEAQGEKAGILAQIEGFRSEQIVNRIGLLQEEQTATETFAAREVELKEQFLLKEEERAIAKIEREAEAHALELESLALNEEEKAALTVAIEDKKNQDITDIRLANNKTLTAADKKFEATRVAQKEATLDAIIGLAGAESAIGKAALIAKELLAIKEQAISLGLFTSKASMSASEALIDGAKGTVKSAAAAPFPANLPLIAGFIASIAGVVSTIKRATSKGKASKFALGGLLSGASHANGGIPTPYGELEGGEAVINRKSTALFKPLLSSINEAGGGVKFANGGILNSAGTAAPGSLFNMDVLADKISAANANLPNPVVAVSEIAEVSGRVGLIEQAGDF